MRLCGVCGVGLVEGGDDVLLRPGTVAMLSLVGVLAGRKWERWNASQMVWPRWECGAELIPGELSRHKVVVTSECDARSYRHPLYCAEAWRQWSDAGRSRTTMQLPRR